MKKGHRFRILLVLLIPFLAGSIITLILYQAAQANNSSEFGVKSKQENLNVIESNARSLIIEFVTPEVSIENKVYEGTTCQELIIDGFGVTDEAGFPKIPFKGTLIGIPNTGQVSFEILEEEMGETRQNINLCPVGGLETKSNPEGWEIKTGMIYKRDATRYEVDEFYPGTPVKMGTDGYIRSQRVAQILFQPFHFNPVRGELRTYKYITVKITFPDQEKSTESSMQAAIDEGSFEELFRNSVINYGQARTWRQKSLPINSLLIENTDISTDAFKILVEKDGIYKLSYSELDSAGVPIAEIDPKTFKIHNQGEEIAIYVDGEEDGLFTDPEYILFYGQKENTKWTDTNVYWLTWGGEIGERMTELDGTPAGSGSTPEQFQTSIRLEEDHYYQTTKASGPEKDHWYWTKFQTSEGLSHTYTVTLQSLSTAVVSTTVRGSFYGHSASPQHHTVVDLNGDLVDDALWSSGVEYTFTATIPQDTLLEGQNQLTVTAPLDGGITRQTFYVNWFEIDYYDTYVAEEDVLWFDGEATGTIDFQLSEFSSADVRVFDITSPVSPTEIINGSAEITEDGYQINFSQSIEGEHHFIALSPSHWLSATAIINDEASDLKNAANEADYIIITHEDFYDEILPLANHRESQDLRVKAVKVQDVYDEFNGGVFDPEAIRSFLEYAYTNWIQPAPSYVLLVGDGNYDPKNNLGSGEPNFIPPYLAHVDSWMGETAADNRYVAVSGQDILPDMHIGRLPVKTSAETVVMVTKILGYESTPPGQDWKYKILFTADTPDDINFPYYSDSVADAYVPAAYEVDKIYYNVTHNLPDAQEAILEAINEGRLIVSYHGHASPFFWAWDYLLHKDSVSSLTNSSRLAFFVPMTCLDGYFLMPSTSSTDASSLGEVIVRAEEKGAIASWSPTGQGVAISHDILQKGLFEAIFTNDVTYLGGATTQAKLYFYMNSIAFRELIDTYVLFGDPFTQLRIDRELYLPMYLPMILR
ncbi:C25 family cysteine peptidase [Chloroflexota bacterium]